MGLLALMGVASSTLAQRPPEPTLNVHLRNDAAVPEDTLETTRLLVNDIFGSAGLHVGWVRDADAFSVVLAPGPLPGIGRAQDVLGFKPGRDGHGRLAYVFMNRVSAIAIGHDVPRSIVLGTAIAHELGHLLLPKAHSAAGIMKPAMDKNDFWRARNRELHFTSEQAQVLRQATDAQR